MLAKFNQKLNFNFPLRSIEFVIFSDIFFSVTTHKHVCEHVYAHTLQQKVWQCLDENFVRIVVLSGQIVNVLLALNWSSCYQVDSRLQRKEELIAVHNLR
jgi:hypothetical protein